MRPHPLPRPRRLALLHAVALAAAGLASPPARAGSTSPDEEKPELTWQNGPAKVSLGDGVAQLDLTGDELFLDGPQTIKLLQKTGNQTSGKEVGLVRSAVEGESWFLLYEYDRAGYVKDDEKDKIDADELLEGIKEGTEQSNEFRKEHGMPGLHVDRWSEPPHYDPSTHNLVWGILAHNDDGGQVINYSVRILGREGVMAVTLMDKPEKIEASKATSREVLGRFSYQPGKTYAEWRQGDKVAEYGLTALVAAGAGGVALKLGLFSKLFAFVVKFLKVILFGLAAGAAAVARFFKSLFGKSNPGGP